MLDKLLNKDPRLGMSQQGYESKLYWGTITNVNSLSNTMDVSISTPDQNISAKDIQINNLFSNMAYGVRVVPSPGSTRVLLFKVSIQEWIHVGYVNTQLEPLMTDKDEKKQESTTALLQRYLEDGEIQIVALSNNEIFLSNTGDVILKTQFGSTIKLDNFMNRFEGNFENCKFEMDHVRLRAGNIIRSIASGTNEDDYVVQKEDDTIIKESALLETEEGFNLKEFMVQVGVELGDDGFDDTSAGPTVGYIAMADSIIQEDGSEIASANKRLNFIAKTASGGGIAIDDEGSFLIMDQGGSVTKFTSGASGEKSLRIENSFITINATDGIQINHESGAFINIESSGYISVRDKSGRGFMLTSTGFHTSVPDGAITMQAKDITLIGNLNLGGGTLRDFLMPATMTSSMFDTHIHAGPAGPPIVPWSPLVLTGALQASKINISG